MTLFWIVAALLIAAAAAFLLTPLLRRTHKAGVEAQPLNVVVYRDQQAELDADRKAGTLSDEQYERARLDLERRLLDDVAANTSVAQTTATSRVPAIFVGVAVPVLAVSVYLMVGNPRALSPLPMPSDAAGRPTPQQIEAMVAKLAERMKQNPGDPKGWAMLAKSYAVMGRFDDAAAAYAKAAERAPGDADVLADYADALAMARGQSLAGEPEALAQRALKIDPNHPKSLALVGTAAFEKKDYAGAIRYWEKLAAVVPPDSEMARDIQTSIKEARGLAGGGDKPAAPSAAGGAGGGVSGAVTLAPALAGKVAPNDTVFIFARAAAADGTGPRMPLAILKKKVSELPLKFTLDDTLAMSPAARLSGAPQVIVSARISKSGDALPRSGDLQGASKAIGNTQKDVTIVIDTEVQ